MMSKKPRYLQIADLIHSEIEQGILKPGDALATENVLCEQHQVSRVTIRKALKQLISENIIESIQGSGTYIKSKPINYDIYQLTSFSEKLTGELLDTHTTILAFSVVEADCYLAERLNIQEKDQIYYVKRVRFIRQKSIMLEETWMPVLLFPDLTYEIMKHSKYEYIEKVKKLKIDRSELEMMPTMPTKEIADILDIDVQTPLLERVSRSFLDDNTVFDFSRGYLKCNDYKFTLVAKRHHKL